MTQSSAIPDPWKEWLLQNLKRGCAVDQLIQKAQANGFERAAIEAVLATSQHSLSGACGESAHDWLHWFQAPLTRPEHRPRAWLLDTPLAQVYELPSFLSDNECAEVINAINGGLQPSTVTRGHQDYRTSRTCHLSQTLPELASQLDDRFAALLGVDPRLSEPIQGQRYDPGEYFKEHTDWFAPHSKEFEEHSARGGQRTWTVMVYLNAVERGGETCFKHLGRCFTPVKGMALAWNNLQADGTPNSFTLHESMPVLEGNKWVITKWFRAKRGRNG